MAPRGGTGHLTAALAFRPGLDSAYSLRAEAALRLYRALGFEQWGIEPDALRVEGQPFAEIHMILRR